MPIAVHKTQIGGVLLFSHHIYRDHRGVYSKCYEKEMFKQFGILDDFTEASDLYSKKGALRGLHYQSMYSQAKLVRVLRGKIFDVALDLRKQSPTFGKYFCQILSPEAYQSIYVPSGFAHGFISLEDDTIFSYLCSGKYDPKSAGGIFWNDPDLSIPWPLSEYGIKEVIATEKDLSWPSFNDFVKDSF